MPASGGTPTLLPDDGINQERYWPSFLPDGRHYIYFGRRQRYGIFAAAIDSPGAKLVLSDCVIAAYAPGCLLGLVGSSRGGPSGTLLAHPFDTSRLEVVGEPKPIAERILYESAYARAAFSVSNNHTLVYGTIPDSTTQLIWFDRRVTALETVGGSEPFAQPALSPDEKTLAVEPVDPVTQDEDIWLIDRERNLASRFTSNPNNLSFFPVWSPSGDRVVFAWARGAPPTCIKRCTEAAARNFCCDRRPTASRPMVSRWTLCGVRRPRSENAMGFVASADAWRARGPPACPLPADRVQRASRTSISGWRLARVRVGRVGDERRVPPALSDASGKTRISINGGCEPRWNGRGSEIFYVTPDAQLMAVPVDLGTTLRIGAPSALFTIRTGRPRSPAFDVNYTVTSDGTRFLIRALTDQSSTLRMTIVLNWTATIDTR